jgi:glycosyltransferase involved in cell wall biosynthesis
MKRLLFLLFFFGGVIKSVDEIYSEKMIVVVTASYNNKEWYEKNLMSIFSQKYFNYHVLYIDDCSTDGTPDLVEKWADDHGVSDRITLIRNKTNRGGLANHYNVIQLIPDRAIVCIVDGDDFLATDYAFKFLSDTYRKKDVWLTYGQFMSWPDKGKGWCCEIPSEYVERNAIREFNHNLSHLRTFYAGLFKQIKKEDLMDGSEFWSINDNPAMYPMAEMARGHVKYLPQVLLMWNNANPLNDHKEAALGRMRQLEADKKIRALKPYNPVISPFQGDAKGSITDLKRTIKKASQENIINVSGNF